MPSYVLGILAQGNCPALVRGGVFSAGGETAISWDRSGLTDIRHAVKAEAKRLGCSNARAFLKLSVIVFSAAAEAEDWLIPLECLDTSSDNVWYDAAEGKVRFCLAANSSRGSSLFELLLQLSAGEAPEVYPYIAKLKDRAETEHLSFAAIKKELSRRLIGPG